jgi:prophage antirepressor-like protein
MGGISMNGIQIFQNAEFGSVRTADINGVPYFVGKDVAEILGYSNTRKALLDHVDEEDKTDGVTIRDSIGREQAPVLINESGLYSLILSSKMPNARRFKRWVTSEILPTIRKHGVL